MTATVRFAPSPTGRLHVGNIRTAILNWLFARKAGGRFILRFDDTDRERSKDEYIDAIRADLSWLGLSWDQEARQSQRTDAYATAIARLKASGRLYPCFEAADELERRRARQLARGLPPIYDRASLKLSAGERAEIEASGRRPHWRFRLANSEAGSLRPEPTLVSWNDLVRGAETVDLGSLSDPVLIREDGTALYTLTSVVDDIDMGITHIIRGEDHVTNTGVQIDLFEALGAEPPAFGHHSLIVGANGEALSKRLGALSILSLREAGLEPMAVACHAALIGTSDPIEPHPDLDALAGLFAPSKISTAPARFDPAELQALNHRYLRTLSFSDVAERLVALGVDGGDAFWVAVRDNLNTLAEARAWWDVVAGPITPMIEDEAFVAVAAELLPAEPWSAETWAQWTGAVKAATGAKGRALFHPLRLALTARETGPELKSLLPLIGRTRVMARLNGQTA
ncbi:MAG: glutamate--tRNA ligase [Hyphomicrobiaceae bacterium]|nr:glutamate--tRNA ligase [Hyphomicrobiaceae bacterium]